MFSCVFRPQIDESETDELFELLKNVKEIQASLFESKRADGR